jgi:hypothetical protein
MLTALSSAAAKVRLVALPEQSIEASSSPDRDRRFRQYVERQSLFRVRAETGEEAITHCKEALREAVVEMVRLGVREARKGKFHTGEALEWSRLDARSRRAAMEAVLRQALREREGAEEHEGQAFVAVDGTPLLVCGHGVPASLTNAPAREMVGQPFLNDHRWAHLLQPPRAGPVHILACHRTATETQAARLLGVADVMTITAPFGVLAVDTVNNVQLALISTCRDDTTTRHGVQRLFEWLQQSGEDRLVRRRAEARAHIIAAVAAVARSESRG